MIRIGLYLVMSLLSFGALAQTNFPTESPVRVMSYNIRYDNPADGKFAWANRKKELAKAVLKENPDVIGFQEALYHQVQDLEQLLGDYDWVGAGRDDGKQGGEFCPIFYKRERFDLGDFSVFWLSETPMDTGSVGWDAALPRTANWVTLSERNGMGMFFFVNTHFDHAGDTALTASATLLNSRFYLAIRSSYFPVVLMGDFNFEPTHNAYRTMEQGGWIDAKTIAQQAAGDITYTGGFALKKTHGKRLDYIWVNPRLKVLRYTVVQAISKKQFYLSDHLPVMIEVLPQ